MIQVPSVKERAGKVLSFPRGYDSVIGRMKSLVCSGIDSMCVFSTFALELEDK